MSERSIPEILGWEPAPADWGYVDRYFQHPTAGYAVNEHGGWSVDDLLAWLRGRGFSVEARTWPTWNDVAVLVDGRESVVAPTLLEALEAGVRAIDAEAS